MTDAPQQNHKEQQQPVMTVAETAVFLGRSKDWVRDRIVCTRLKTLHPFGTSPVLITEASARILKDQLTDQQPAGKARGSHLTLVVNNTATINDLKETQS